jgi:hypothetical protein
MSNLLADQDLFPTHVWLSKELIQASGERKDEIRRYELLCRSFIGQFRITARTKFFGGCPGNARPGGPGFTRFCRALTWEPICSKNSTKSEIPTGRGPARLLFVRKC